MKAAVREQPARSVITKELCMSLHYGCQTTPPRMSRTAIGGWCIAISVWLALIWGGWHYRVSIEIWLVVTGLGGAVFGLLVLDRQGLAAKRRTFALHQIADQRGWHFLPEGHADVLSSFARFELGVRGHAHQVSNLLSGTIDGVQFYVFDFGFIDGSGKGARTCRQSVVWLQRDDARLPSFSVYPALFWWTRPHRTDNGRRKIDMPGPRWFTRRYDVRVRDEPAVLRLLAPEVLPFFQQKEAMAVEGSGRDLIVCKKTIRLIEPDELILLLQSSQRVLNKLCANASSTPG